MNTLTEIKHDEKRGTGFFRKPARLYNYLSIHEKINAKAFQRAIGYAKNYLSHYYGFYVSDFQSRRLIILRGNFSNGKYILQ